MSATVPMEQRIEALESKVQAIGEGLSDILQNLARVDDAINVQADRPWDPSQIAWVAAEGSKGPYQRYPAPGENAEATADYKAMLADLKAHKGKLSRNGFFYWVFTDGAVVGRKPRKQ